MIAAFMRVLRLTRAEVDVDPVADVMTIRLPSGVKLTPDQWEAVLKAKAIRHRPQVLVSIYQAARVQAGSADLLRCPDCPRTTRPFEMGGALVVCDQRCPPSRVWTWRAGEG